MTENKHLPQDPPAALPEETTAMVLLVDDQMMIGEAVRRLLAGLPYIEFHYCANPGRAIEAAVQMRPTVILQDLVMPGINGLDLVRQYRATPSIKDVPIIVLSARDEPSLKSDAFLAGANDYLVKLPDQIELIARIRYHSMAYQHRRQRDEAYRALQESQRQLMESNFELLRLSNTDALTGLSNRRHFDEYLEAEWRRAMRAQSPLSLLLIDVDYFKQYNDTYGHPAGDAVLTKVADLMQKHCGRATDMEARLGGDEFAMILPMTDHAGAREVAEQLRNKMEGLQIPHSASAVARHLTVTIGGTSMVPQRLQSAFVLSDAADRALYQAKAAGRNRVIVSTPGAPV